MTRRPFPYYEIHADRPIPEHRAWMGDSAPTSEADLCPEARRYADNLFYTHYKQWLDFWGVVPDESTCMVFARRSLSDAWATYRQLGADRQ